MINTGIKIGDGEIKDTYEAYGFAYVSSDSRFSAPIKGFATSSFPEQAGVNIDPRTVDDEFEYKIKFCVLAPNKNLENANSKIRQFNTLNYDYDESTGIKTYKQITLYNYYKRALIIGYAQPLEEATDFWRDNNGVEQDAVQIELTIKVADPTVCNFDIDLER